MDAIAARGAKALVSLLLLGGGVWSTLFVWYRFPAGEGARGIAAASIALAFLASLVLLLRWGEWRGAAAGFLVLAGLIGWFEGIAPRPNRDWAEDVSRPLRATVDGTRAVVRDVRAFAWRTDRDFTPRWEERSYDLAAIRTVDIVNSYWAGRAIAHTLLSFGFADGRHLAFSVEIRREKGEEFSDIAGFFKQYELVFVAADERDLIGVRTNVRGEDAELYRVKAEPDQVRRAFVEILARANRLADMPAWYNSLTRNCTTEMFGVARTVDPDLSFGWRIVLSGYVPDWAYDEGLLDRRVPFPELRARAKIAARAKEAGLDAPDFSARIRAGVPDPNR